MDSFFPGQRYARLFFTLGLLVALYPAAQSSAQVHITPPAIPTPVFPPFPATPTIVTPTPVSTPRATPTPVSSPSSPSGSNAGFPNGNTISSLTGSASGISGADTNLNHYGNYNAGSISQYNTIGGPLLNDSQAAQFVVTAPESQRGSNSTVAADNNYFNSIAGSNPQNYLNQLSGFYSSWQGNPMQAEADRIDGACPMANPTQPETVQWAMNKWGINPLLGYADATVESNWNQAGLGDNGTSAGLFQVADRVANHAFPGFGAYPGESTAGQNLARENTCFNADFWGAYIYAAYHGLVGSPGGDINAAIQSWYSGSASSGGSYSQSVDDTLTNQSWISLDFNGQNVPY